MEDIKEKLLKKLNSLCELITNRDDYQKEKYDLSNELAELKPKGYYFINIFEFIKENLIIKIIYALISVISLILVLILFKPLGFNVPMQIYVPVSILVVFLVIFIYKKIDSILKSILSLVGILIVLNIFKILPINYFLNSIFSCLLGMLISLIVCLPICLIWYFIKFSKYMANKTAVVSKNKEVYEQRKKELKNSIEEVDVKIEQYNKKIDKLNKKELHDKYLTRKSIKKFIEYLETSRCDTLKECINLYEKELAYLQEQEKLFEIELEKKKILEKEAKEKERERKEREQREKENSESFKAIAKGMNDVQNFINEERHRRKN